MALTNAGKSEVSCKNSSVVLVNGRKADGDSSGCGAIVVGWDSVGAVLELDGPDVVDINIPDGPADIEVADIRWKNIHNLLYFFQTLRSGVIENLELKIVSALVGWVVDSIDVLIFGGDVENVDSGGETAVGFGESDHKRIDGVGAGEPFGIDDTADGQTQTISGRAELIGQGQYYS